MNKVKTLIIQAGAVVTFIVGAALSTGVVPTDIKNVLMIVSAAVFGLERFVEGQQASATLAYKAATKTP
jgi:hypothetical protein